MTFSSFSNDHADEYTKDGLALAQAMITAGATDDTVISAIAPYKIKVESRATVKQVASTGVFPFTMGCPHCKSTMREIHIKGNKRVAFCSKDRVCLPFRVEDK